LGGGRLTPFYARVRKALAGGDLLCGRTRSTCPATEGLEHAPRLQLVSSG